jgi:DNA-binding Lrp family transcriptional regulator
LSPSEYGTPERLAGRLAKCPEVGSVDLVTGDWDLIVKVRTRDQDEYYNFLRNVISGEEGLQKTTSMISLKQIKSEFVL